MNSFKFLALLALCGSAVALEMAAEEDDTIAPFNDDIEPFSSGDDYLRCGEKFSFQSPGFPSNYPANSYTIGSVTMPPNVKFVMKCGSPFEIPSGDHMLLQYTYPPTGQNLGSSQLTTPVRYGGYTFSLGKASYPIRVDISLVATTNGGVFSCTVEGSDCTVTGPTTTTTTTTTTLPSTSGATCGTCPANRIINGGFASDDEYCFMAKLHIQTGPTTWSQCGATLLTPNTLLTAAHCVDHIPANPTYEVRAYFNSDQGSHSNMVLASSVVVHSGWTGQNNQLCSVGNDIAIIKLQSDVQLSGSVRLACLPTGCLHESGANVFTAGWGLTAQPSQGGSVSANLKEATMTTTTTLCNCDDSVICAEEVSGRTCQGDSGSFMGNRDNAENRWTIQGVTSYGPSDCKELNTQTNPAAGPSGFAQVCKFYNWIRNNSGDIARLQYV